MHMKCEVFGTIKNAAMDTAHLNGNAKKRTERMQSTSELNWIYAAHIHRMYCWFGKPVTIICHRLGMSYIEFEIWTDNRTTPSTKKDQRNWLALLSVHVPCTHHKLLYTYTHTHMNAMQGIGMLAFNLRNVKSGRWYFQKSIFWRDICFAVRLQTKQHPPFVLHAENVHKTHISASLGKFIVHFLFTKTSSTGLRWCWKIKTL